MVLKAGFHRVTLSGTPEGIGRAHAELLGPEMRALDEALLERFAEEVPRAWVRRLLVGLARFRFRHLGRSFDPDRLAEIRAQALALGKPPLPSPPRPGAQVSHGAAGRLNAGTGRAPNSQQLIADPFKRLLLLNALYDIALSFEGSPLVGCTSFVLPGERGPLLARNFDFDAHPRFDQEKVVFTVMGAGKIPFLSVAWPGLVGVVSGMNAKGLALVVHGARAGKLDAEGEPLVHSARRLLETAHDVPSALAVVDQRGPMVSHILVLVDSSGRAVKVERVPKVPSEVLELVVPAAVTNHFEGKHAGDAKNLRVQAESTSLLRLERARELLRISDFSRVVTPGAAVAFLRDRSAPGGARLPLGDERCIDGLIAAHSVVFDTGNLIAWVNEGPHALGRCFPVQLPKDSGEATLEPEELGHIIEADPLLGSKELKGFLAKRPKLVRHGRLGGA